MQNKSFAVSVRSFASTYGVSFKHMLAIPLALVLTANAAAQTFEASAASYAKFAALNDVCTDLVPEQMDAIRAGRHSFEHDNALALLVLKTHADVPTLTIQYRELIVAADTVFTTEMCRSSQFAELPYTLSAPMVAALSAR